MRKTTEHPGFWSSGRFSKSQWGCLFSWVGENRPAGRNSKPDGWPVFSTGPFFEKSLEKSPGGVYSPRHEVPQCEFSTNCRKSGLSWHSCSAALNFVQSPKPGRGWCRHGGCPRGTSASCQSSHSFARNPLSTPDTCGKSPGKKSPKFPKFGKLKALYGIFDGCQGIRLYDICLHVCVRSDWI